VTALAGKRILVTGGAGFLGSHLLEELAAVGVRDVVVPRRREVDLTDQASTERLFERERPDVVFHLAAEVGGIGANRENPGRYFYANMMMGANVVEQCRRHEVEKVIVAGTVCAYPKHTPVPFKEDELWSGYPEETNAPYGVAKKALLVMLQSYRAQYGLNGIYLLPANLYGPRDNFDLETSHVIPALIRKFGEATLAGDTEVVVWGTGQASREFLYVTDAARALLMAAERYDDVEPVNVGTGVEVTIRELVEHIADITGFEGDVVWDTSKPDGQPRRALDVTRAEELFGFTAAVGIDEGLRSTLAWWKQEMA
jgi:GDP-L-fucose synthase